MLKFSEIQDYNKAIELNPDFADAYNNRGIAKYDLGDYRGAIQDYNKAIELNPDFADAYYNRGIAKYDLGDKNGSCLDWSKAGELGDETAYDLIKEHCQ
jgi:tetratricopeptide (TPR) repeat protein